MTQDSTFKQENLITIVGIGASAGGLAALKQFFFHVPEDSGLAYVVVAHLSPEHQSTLAELLQPHIKMPALHATETLPLQPNHVYVIPPNANLNTIDTHLRLSELEEKRSETAPIDHFFRTLAETHQNKAVGIILTGAGSDGALGLKEIKQKGGLAIVQDPSEAEYDDMPKNAIATGLVDLVVPVKEMPNYFIPYAHPKENSHKANELTRLSDDMENLLAATDLAILYLDKELRIQRFTPKLGELFNVRPADRGRPVSGQTHKLGYNALIDDARKVLSTLQPLEKELTGQQGNTYLARILPYRTADDRIEGVAITFVDISDRKKMEERLRKSEKRFRALVNSASNIIYRMSADWKEMRELDGRGVMTDTKRPDKNWMERYIHPDDQSKVSKAVQEAIHTRSIFSLEHRVREADGAFGWTFSRAVPIMNDKGDVVEWFGSASDITDRKQAEQEVIKAKVYAESIVETLHEPLLVLHPDLRVKSANPAFFEHFQVNLQETDGKLIYELGNGQWNIPALRTLLEDVLPENNIFNDFEITHHFEQIGERVMLVNARRLDHVQLILLGIRDITRKKEFELALKRSEEKYRQLFTSIDSGYCIVEILFDENEVPTDYRFLEVNPAFEKNTGLKDAEGKTMRELQPEHEEGWFEIYGRIAKTGNAERFIQKAKYLGDRWYDVYAFRVDQAKKRRVAILFTDITERIKYEQTIKESEAKLQAITNLVPDLLWSCGPDGYTTWINQRWVEYTGQTMEQTGGWGWADAIHPDDRETTIRKYREAMESGLPLRSENRIRRHDGEYRWFLVQAQPFRNEQGEIIRWYGAATDMHEERMASEKIRQSEERLKLILESATDYAIFTLDTGRNVTDWNTGAEILLGYKKEEIFGRSVDILFLPEERDTAPATEQKVAEEKGRAENERWHIRKDGSRFWGSGITMSLHDKNGQLIGFLKIMRDHTERMKMEESLREAKEAAENAAAAKEEFLAHMSHEIRTPLNAIVGFSHLLLQQDPRPAQLNNLKTLKFSAENLHTLINDILDFSKIQAGKMSLTREEINLPEMLENILQIHLTSARKKGVQLRLQRDEDLPHIIISDQLKLSQVLNNLLSNAVKFTHEGWVALEVKLNRREANRLWIDFAVQDTGIGISGDKMQKIFDVFNQGDSSTARQYGGTGLGLTLCRMYLEMIDSEIKVESAPGKGSRFYFTLPALKGRGEKLKKKTKALTDGEMKKLKALLVEDADINRMVIKQFLQNWWGLNCDEATNGGEAIEMAKKQKYNLILMDVRMPVMDGYKATKEIRRLPGYKDVPIIALTADVTSKVKQEVEGGLFSDLIIKPVEPEELQQKIVEYSGLDLSVETINSEKHSYKELNLEKVSDLMKNDPSGIKMFLQKTMEELKIIQARFNKSIENKDRERLRQLEHKYKWTFDLLQLNNLHDHILHTLELLSNEIEDNKLEKAKTIGAQLIGQIRETIEEKIKEV